MTRAAPWSWASSVTRTIVAIGVRRLPRELSERYVEECEADLAWLEDRGAGAPVEHALGFLCSSRSLAAVVATSSARSSTALARRALAHFGLAPDPCSAAGADNHSYVFAGRLRWRPLDRDERAA